MTLRNKVLIFTTASFLLAIGVGTYHQFNLYRKLLQREKEDFCKESTSQFVQLVDFHKRIANSISAYVANDEEVKELFVKGDREALYRKLKPLYEHVRKENLIREMTLFKLPADLFLNVRVPGAKPRKTKRADIIEAGKTCTTTKSIIICVNYVGIRAVNPIVRRGRTLGVVSVGIDMKDFLKHYTSLTGVPSGLAVKDEVLKRSLRSESYKRYVEGRIRKDNLIIELSKPAEVIKGRIDFSQPLTEVEVGGSLFLVCSNPIKDFSGNEIGYFFTHRDISSLSAGLARESLKELFKSYVPLFLIIFIGSVLLLRRVSDKVDRLLRLTEFLKKRKFEELRQYKPRGNDEFSRIESSILELAEEMEKYISTLSKDIEVYTSKAYVDNLTGIFNRRAFDEFGRDLIERFLSMKRPISILMIDIDDFKKVNDTYGHQTGDKVLAEIGRLIREALRESDLVFRYGGEEFLAILPSTPLEGALRAADNVRKKIEHHSFNVGDDTYNLTVSVGVAQASEKDEGVDELIERADKALYIAKKTGKNRVVSET
ncbi:diguanylate cyclase [Hydrogenivirga sp.]